MEKDMKFPLYVKDSHIDRLFKTITFNSNRSGHLRLKAIDINQNDLSIVDRKHVNLHIPASEEYDPSKIIFRIRSKMAMSIDGIKESYWVTQKHFNETQAKEFNHFRIRGISHDGQRSDWVYSNIKDLENDTIILEMLHDILDALLLVDDKSLEYVIDTAVHDAMFSLYKDQSASFDRVYDQHIDFLSAINEISGILTDKIKNEFNDDIVSSIQSFSELVKSYKLKDRFKEENTDFLLLLLESFLDDKLDRIIENTNFKAILSNEEEIQILLNSIYEFDIKRSIINALYQINLEDNIVTYINDAVKLISEPSVYEKLNYSNKELYLNLFRHLLTELYVPLLVLDQQSALLEIDLKDKTILDKGGDIVEYDFYDNNGTDKHLILKDILSLLLEELDIKMFVNSDLVDFILTKPLERKLGIWIEYAPVEFVEYMTSIKENLNTSLLVSSASEENKWMMNVEDLVESHHKQIKNRIQESFQNSMQEVIKAIQLFEKDELKEVVLIQFLDSFMPSYLQKESNIDFSINLTPSERLNQKKLNHEFKQKALQKILFIDDLSISNLESSKQTNDIIHPDVSMSYVNIFKPSIEDKVIAKKQDKNETLVCPEPSDYYIMNENEFVHYVLGSNIGGTPLGKFVLGINTLKGK